MKLLLLIATAVLASPALAAPRHQSGVALAKRRAPQAGLGIIHGHYADDNQFPFMASITMDDTFACGGSLISDKFILTAGQCASGYDSFTIILGDVSIMFASDTLHLASTYKSIVHEEYREDMVMNDIGLLELLIPVKFNAGISPIVLPGASDAAKSFEGQTATVSGWGTTQYGYAAYDLMYVDQPIMSNERCKRFLGSYVTDSVICGDGEGGIGACGTDAGDPLFVTDATGKTFTQIGIFSFGSDLGCTWGYPSAYTRVTEYLAWIAAKTNPNPTTTTPAP